MHSVQLDLQFSDEPDYYDYFSHCSLFTGYHFVKMPKRALRFVIYIVVLLVLATLLLKSRQNQQPSIIAFNKPMQRKDNRDGGRSSKFHRTIPTRVIKNVKRFIFFAGYAHSGHSIIASLLDAHPNIVIAHEYSLFSKWLDSPVLHSNKTWLFNALYENSQYHGLRAENAMKKGYSLIPDWWQGKYDKSIHVIGDKAGGMTTLEYRRDRSIFNFTYQQLKRTLNGVPVSVIHVLRNPYDNIATMLLYNRKQRRLVNETHKYRADKELRNEIINYFIQVEAVVDMIKNIRLNVIELHSADMISDSKQTIRKVCSRLHLDCTDKYLHMCAQTTYPAESRSRDLVQWTEENIRIVAQSIQRFDSLKRYTY